MAPSPKHAPRTMASSSRSYMKIYIWNLDIPLCADEDPPLPKNLVVCATSAPDAVISHAAAEAAMRKRPSRPL